MAEHKIPLPRKREYNKRTMNPGMTQFHNSIDWCDDLDIPSTTLHAIILFEVTGFTEDVVRATFSEYGKIAGPNGEQEIKANYLTSSINDEEFDVWVTEMLSKIKEKNYDEYKLWNLISDNGDYERATTYYNGTVFDANDTSIELDGENGKPQAVVESGEFYDIRDIFTRWVIDRFVRRSNAVHTGKPFEPQPKSFNKELTNKRRRFLEHHRKDQAGPSSAS